MGLKRKAEVFVVDEATGVAVTVVVSVGVATGVVFHHSLIEDVSKEERLA